MSSSILLVEDDLSLSAAYKEVLGKQGFNLYTARDGVEALKLVKRYTFELILLDLLMPNMSGLEFLKAYQPVKPANTHIIAFTNWDEETVKKDVVKYGADEIIIKANLTPHELVAHIKSLKPN